MSNLDEQLKQSLHTIADEVVPDPNDLLVVRRRAADARRRRGAAVAMAALAVAGLVAIALVVLGHGRNGRPEPVAPRPTSKLPDPFTILRTVDVASAGINAPLKVAVGPNGHVYVSDRSQHVTELSETGSVLRRWGGKGTDPGRFRLYSGALAVGSDGRVYVADTGNFRIQVFSPDGRFLAQYGGYGTGSGKFVWPSDVVVGRDGTMYVADDRAATVTALSPSGQELWRHGAPDETDPDLIGHEHLGGVDATGRLVTANDDVGKVLYVSPAGRVVDSFSTDAAGAGVDASGVPGGHFPNGACGATLDQEGDVYVSSCEESYSPRHDTAVYDPQHHLVAGWMRGILVDSPVFGPNGHAWAVTAGNRALVELAVTLPPR